MAIDILQDKIRKMKNPLVLDLALPAGQLPQQLTEQEGSAAAAYGRFCRELLTALKGTVPAVRVGYTAFSLLGPDGLAEMIRILKEASAMGYYTILEGPYILSPMMAQATADAVFGPAAIYPCDGLILTAYPGSDVVKPYVSKLKGSAEASTLNGPYRLSPPPMRPNKVKSDTASSRFSA